ncbi:MFS efflux transporter, putative [Talaromyces stipitatus ATCC 10500]|uniref:MFS efflux transporter, putative n=1 Tax=Talaromyces stipitatus (strain ATCC 10500 / CBS 375.48 / QM 6759 / NRRL 1006) TaxID=441959 RepID=B8LXH4_TALSN|nr:MFS efflux transporter, putative [Talaromyces stipitatus ATCC 10500]EED23255.1 MFS efflux transporter, putative [Talaromyces stipitatus ATCC 10500]
MASHFAAFLEVESSSPVTSPATVLRHDERLTTASSTNHEWIELQSSGSIVQRPGSFASPPPDLENLHPETGSALGEADVPLSRPDSTEIVPSLYYPAKNKWRAVSASCILLAQGLSDSAPGALIPYMEQNFHVGYAIVSLIFVTNAVGYILAAPLTYWLENRLGRSRTAMISQLSVLTGYLIIVCKAPFPAVVFSFFLIGLGSAIILALNNVFLANLTNSTELLGINHGFYGVGGTIAPLIATALASKGVHWTFFYIINLTFAAFNLIYSGWAFQGYEKDMPLQALNGQNQDAEQRAKKNLIGRALKTKATLLCALFVFAYQGAEVSISGWIVSFLIHYRNGDPAHVGYVSSGFWAGITVGRFVLSYPARRLGERLAVFSLVVGSVLFQILSWFVPNIVGEAVTVAVIGLLLGPIYPCATVVLNRLLPRDIQTTSLSFVSAMGSSGGAVAPFVTGILAQSVGTVVLHPVCLGLYGLMILAWFLLPQRSRRED